MCCPSSCALGDLVGAISRDRTAVPANHQPIPIIFFPIHPYSCFGTGENPQNGWQNNPTPPLTKMVIFTFPIAPS